MTVNEKLNCIAILKSISDMEAAEGDGDIMAKIDELCEGVLNEKYDCMREVGEDIFWVYYNEIKELKERNREVRSWMR